MERHWKMEKIEESMHSETHVLCFSFPAQGHLSPILQFSKRLTEKGIKVTLISTDSFAKKFIQTQSSSIMVELISDGFKEGERDHRVHEFFERFKAFVTQSLAQFIEKQLNSDCPPKFLVYDSLIPGALDIARKFGIGAAPFFTQPWAVTSIYYHFHKGAFKVPLEEPVVSLPSMPPLRKNDLPSFLDGTDTYRSSLNLFLCQFSNIEEPKWLFCNTFDKLEDEVVNWMTSKYAIKNIGPSIPSTYIDKRLENDKHYGLSIFKPDTEACMKWLDSKETGSVIYVSFGSLAALGEEQMGEVASGLKRRDSYFLWVVRDAEQEKLPSNFAEETSEKGLVVSWSPQLEVLSHRSVGCFLTHCGWNSTLEALSLGVPMVAMPQWGDQTTNAKFIADVWEVGVRARINKRGIVTREEIENCIREITEGERAKDMRRNSQRWKELAKEAVDGGGSSDNNIEEFVIELVRN